LQSYIALKKLVTRHCGHQQNRMRLQ